VERFYKACSDCQRQCLETALMAQLARLHALPTGLRLPRTAFRSGLLMVARGWLTHEQVVTALDAAATGPLGADRGLVRETRICHRTASHIGARLQWGMSGYVLAGIGRPDAVWPIPLAILEAFQMSATPVRARNEQQSTLHSDSAWITPRSMPSKNYSIAAPSPVWRDARLWPMG